LIILAGVLAIACITAASGGPDDDVFDAPAFPGILLVESDIAVASVIFYVASFHLLASLMWIASLQLLIFLLLLVSCLLVAFLLRMSGIFVIDVIVHFVTVVKCLCSLIMLRRLSM
jgi:hypothetical protein